MQNTQKTNLISLPFQSKNVNKTLDILWIVCYHNNNRCNNYSIFSQKARFCENVHDTIVDFTLSILIMNALDDTSTKEHTSVDIYPVSSVMPRSICKISVHVG